MILINKSDGYDFQDFRKEIVAVLVGFLRGVVEVEPLGVCHAYIGEDHRVEVAHHEVSEQFGVGFGSGYEDGLVYCQTWHEGAFGRSVVDDAFEEGLVDESFHDRRHHAPPDREDEDDFGGFLKDLGISFYEWIGRKTFGVVFQIIGAENGIEVVGVEIYHVVGAAFVFEASGYVIENHAVE